MPSQCDRCLAPIWNCAISSLLGDRCPDCFRRFGSLPDDDTVTIYHRCDPTVLRNVIEKIRMLRKAQYERLKMA